MRWLSALAARSLGLGRRCQLPRSHGLAILAGDRFARIYSNGARQGAIRSIDLHIDAIPARVQVELESARLVSSDIVHAGDTVMVEATLRPWQQPARNVRIPITLPAASDPAISAFSSRMPVRWTGLWISPAFRATPPILRPSWPRPAAHPADRIYVSLLVPETQAGVGGQTLTSLPLSIANALEPMRAAQDVNLNGESAESPPRHPPAEFSAVSRFSICT